MTASVFPKWEVESYGTNAVRVYRHDALTARAVWEFVYFDGALNLQRFTIEQRASPRHRKWVAHGRWSAQETRYNTMEAVLVPELSDALVRRVALTFLSRVVVRQRMNEVKALGARLHDRVWTLDALRPSND